MPETIDSAVQIARDNAPYLAESLSLFPDCPKGLKKKGAGDYLKTLFSGLPHTIGDLDSEMAVLRQLKRHAHLGIALCDIGGIWDWDSVTEHLTQLSDIAMSRLLQCCARAQNIEGTADNPVPGLFILAVGKYGARELNYSSDIDFCVFYDPDIIALPNMTRAERTLIKFVQSLIAGFERITVDGYVFRTDLRLRPDPRSNAVAVSTLTAERYYETLGQNWERAAMIKARVCGGDKAVGQDFIDHVLAPFIWRRSLDYAAIEDIHSIKRQIHATKSGDSITAAGHHLKLGYGGIREIEFYAQTQQLILGGRQPHLRTMRTVDAMRALTDFKAVDPDVCDSLIADYAKLRKLEHAAQMMEDAQTHISPADNHDRARLAALTGYADLADFDHDLVTLLKRVHGHYVDLFPDSESLSSPVGSLSFTGLEPGPGTIKTLETLGFEDIDFVWQSTASWLGGRIPATRTERARELLTRLAPKLIAICSDAPNPDLAFRAFAGFFTRLSAGVALLSMFLQETDRLADIIKLMTSSQRLSDTISHQPAILDAMIEPSFLQIDIDDLGAGYLALVNDNTENAGAFENAMNAMRRAVHEDQFRISAAVLSGRLAVDHAGPALSKVADCAVQAMLPVAARETMRVTGPLNGDYAVLALGKAGGQELSLSSDLDVMVIYRPHSDDLGVHRQFTKLTQRFVSALSAVTAEGRLYDIDMALRPSGRSGPVAVSVDAFARYYDEKAWTWEFMALTRARVVASSSADFTEQLDGHVLSALTTARPDLDTAGDIADMLVRLRREKPARGPWDVKQMEGGLRDIEFIVQKAYLMQPNRDLDPRPISTEAMIAALTHPLNAASLDVSLLTQATRFYHQLTQALTMTVGTLSDGLDANQTGQIAKILGTEPAELTARRDDYSHLIQGMVTRYIGLS
ncbi:bifunctional [glutamine synthetase] adenylyltransferase/[glutamine synthetase]-adenylyl-L-tyrosine phosphorylase [Fretibacter rubidus]|uniref:bifunctional [glutamine synthetase] adenylyltransferase/[glutamine synthetase]-adenylyl-L-tyrosine phosphorylase n=1 Tax=Fretibacter rubidus TaxID=570162 RepID=UPI00352ACB68